MLFKAFFVYIIKFLIVSWYSFITSLSLEFRKPCFAEHISTNLVLFFIFTYSLNSSINGSMLPHNIRVLGRVTPVSLIGNDDFLFLL